LDIQPFVEALSDPEAFLTTNNLTLADLLAVADINQDGELTGVDIQPFVELLSSGANLTATEQRALALVPEPGTAVALLPLLLLGTRRRARSAAGRDAA
jgi:hypothetical protein